MVGLRDWGPVLMRSPQPVKSAMDARVQSDIVLRRWVVRIVIGRRIRANLIGVDVVFCWLAVVFGVVIVTAKLLVEEPGGM